MNTKNVKILWQIPHTSDLFLKDLYYTKSILVVQCNFVIFNINIKIWDHTGYVFNVKFLEHLHSIPRPLVQFLKWKRRPSLSSFLWWYLKYFFILLSVELNLHNNKQHTRIHTCDKLFSDQDTFLYTKLWLQVSNHNELWNY